MTESRLVKMAKQYAKYGVWINILGEYHGRHKIKPSISKKYKPGEIVVDVGGSWPSRRGKEFIFISSFRLGGNGCYCVLNPRSHNVTYITNIRSKKEVDSGEYAREKEAGRIRSEKVQQLRDRIGITGMNIPQSYNFQTWKKSNEEIDRLMKLSDDELRKVVESEIHPMMEE